MSLPFKTVIQHVAFQQRTGPLSSCSSGLVLPAETVQPRRDRTEHGGLTMPHDLLPSSPKALISSFTWRGSASIQSSRELHRTVLLGIWLLVQIRGFPDHLRLNLVPFFELLDQPLSVFPGGLHSDVITMDRSGDSPPLRSLSTLSLVPCASRSPPTSSLAPIPSFEQRHGYRTSSFSAAHTGSW